MSTERRELQVSSSAPMPSIEQDVAGVKRMMVGLDTLIKDVLRKDEDYGIIPGTQKPTLLKPGSEKILGMLNCAAETEVAEKIEDYEKGFFCYTVKVSAVHRGSGQVVGEGIGACNSREKRYKNQDPFQLQNTILKMAKKRAQIDCALTVGMASEKFTQDMEPGESGSGEDALATPAQVSLILKITRSHVFSEDEQKGAWKFCEENPTKEKAEKFIDRIQGLVKERKAQEASTKPVTAPSAEASPDPPSDPAQCQNEAGTPGGEAGQGGAFVKSMGEYRAVLGGAKFMAILREKGFSAVSRVPENETIQAGIVAAMLNAVNAQAAEDTK